MRFEGVIKTWNDDRGFGFIEPTLGGDEIFVHIKAIRGLNGRPRPLQRVSFEVELGPQGKKRARNVAIVKVRQMQRSQAQKKEPATWGMATLLAIPAFLLVVVAAYHFGHPPGWLIKAYVIASVVTFIAYAIDKSAAKNGAWRTSEKTLHLLGLLGGWPGALIAQQFLHHKSTKARFRASFWTIVVANIAGFVFLVSPFANTIFPT